MKTTDLECLISLYMDGELSEPMQNRVVFLLKTNKRAAAIYNDFLQIHQLFQKTPRLTLPAGFSNDILVKINQRTINKPLTRLRFFLITPRRVTIISTVTATLFLLGLIPVFMMVWRSPGETALRNDNRGQSQMEIPKKETSLTQTSLTQTSSVPLHDVPDQSIPKVVLSTPAVPLAVGASTEQKTAPEKRSFVACKLKSGQEDAFYLHFQQVSTERKLSFKRSVRSGYTIMEFNLTKEQFQNLVRWLDKRTDYVQSVNVFGDLVQWQEEMESGDTTASSAVKDEVRQIRFEFK